jgi:hypothetical protein
MRILVKETPTMSSAELCRRNNWIPGTFLNNTAGFFEIQIQITAIGEDKVLARRMAIRDVGGPWNFDPCSEQVWTDLSSYRPAAQVKPH